MSSYLRIYRPDHPKAAKNGWVFEHVAIAEDALGKRLPRGAEVHHVNEDPEDNAPANLVICQNRGYHKLLHVRTRIVRAGGDPDAQRICSRCGLQPFSAFNRFRAGLQRLCRRCQSDYCRSYGRVLRER